MPKLLEHANNIRTKVELRTFRGCLHGTGMTSIPERVHSIPIDITVSVYMIPGWNFVPYKSFQNGLIPVFNPNEILVLEWDFILA